MSKFSIVPTDPFIITGDFYQDAGRNGKKGDKIPQFAIVNEKGEKIRVFFKENQSYHKMLCYFWNMGFNFSSVPSAHMWQFEDAYENIKVKKMDMRNAFEAVKGSDLFWNDRPYKVPIYKLGNEFLCHT